MALLADRSLDAGSNIVQGTGSNSVTFTMPGNVVLDVEAVVATIDNTAGGATTATLTIRDQSGQVIDVAPQGSSIPAGESDAVAAWARRQTDSAVDDGLGIKFDTFPQTGHFLRLETTGGLGPSGYGIQLVDDGNAVHISSDDGAGGGEIFFASPFIRLDTALSSLRLLDDGESFFEGTDASWTFSSSWVIDSPSFIFDLTQVGATLTVNDHTGAPIFRIDENGDLHGKTGKTLTFDL